MKDSLAGLARHHFKKPMRQFSVLNNFVEMFVVSHLRDLDVGPSGPLPLVIDISRSSQVWTLDVCFGDLLWISNKFI